MNMSDMGMHTEITGVSATALVLRIVLLLATATVAGVGLFRPAVVDVGRRAVVVAWTAAAVTAVIDIASIFLLNANIPFAVVQLLLAVAVPPLLKWSAPPAYAGLALLVVLISEIALDHAGLEFLADTACALAVVSWLGLTVLASGEWKSSRLRPKPVALTLAVVLTLAGVLQILVSGVGCDRRLFASDFGMALLAVALLPIVVTVLSLVLPRRVYPIGAFVVVIAYSAWGALGAIGKPADLPTPGVPLLGQITLAGQQVPILVTPQQPGKNLVHLPDIASVRVQGEAAAARPGSDGTWAEVTLPPGRSTLTVEREGTKSTIEVDAGAATGPDSAIGPDGAECASAALGGLLGGAHDVLTNCPADVLSEGDTDALRKLVGFLASRPVPAITVVGDNSPRSIAAGEVVRTAAAQRHVPVDTQTRPDNALVLVSGWAAAAAKLGTVSSQQTEQPTFTHGVYLAPWLLTSPLAKSVVSSAIPLRFDPREQRSLTYTVTLANSFGGETASIAGFDQWLRAQGQSLDERVRVYASAQVDVMQMQGMDMDHGYPGQWVPNGTVVPISGPLSD
jgi:hypothetical protein